MSLSATQFDDFFKALWGHDPFPWQRRLAQQVCSGNWPRFIDLPTSSGKTACVDVAVLALAVQVARNPAERTVGRRIFFVVNRRVIVDEAYERAEEIAKKLRDASSGTILYAVAEALRLVSGDADAPPLDVAMMRGGIVRDNRWARSITQPTIITSTIDQVGSRLLFRGYGVSPEAAPMHAALIAHDSTILLDEAHISQPFAQTLDAVRRYSGETWAEQPINTPFHFVQMTATPGDVPNTEVFRLDDEDRDVLQDRHGKPKLISLRPAAKAKGKNAIAELAAELAAKAVELQDDQHRNIAVVVNRVATARAVHQRLPEVLHKLKRPECDIYLAIGRMRPLDRDELTRAIQARVGKARVESDDDLRPMFVVATQCLEVGADFDFDAMVSECASLDALRQRFGRLNRTGRDINARGCVMIRADQVEGDDRIYGPALAATWAWLQSVATGNAVDFGVNAMNAKLDGADNITEMLAPRPDAPVMFPAYVDMWAQTNPIPAPDPDVSLFLHGPQRGEPDVNVCWRDDLPENDNEEIWRQIVSLCPPSSPECMPVPIGVVRAWLAHPEREPPDEDRSDLLGSRIPDKDEEGRAKRHALAWRGVERCTLIRDLRRDLRPGDTIVLRATAGGWDTFGHIPDESPKDIAERAYQRSRGRVVLRLYPQRLENWPEDESVEPLRTWIADAEVSLRRDDLRAALRQAAALAPHELGDVAKAMRLLAKPALGLEEERYPDGKGVVLRTRRRTPESRVMPAMDDGEDELSRVRRERPVPLDEHLQHVRCELDTVLRLLPANDWAEALHQAADLHDLGKADERFQALLINGDCTDAGAQPALWAKSARMPSTPSTRRAARAQSKLPDGFRHEMLSVQLAERAADRLPRDPVLRDLILHLIAAHHGRGRPFAPVVIDDDPPEVTLELPGLSVRLAAAQRLARPPHRLDSGVAERFWKLTRRFGWWGLAYLEAILRLADQRASQREDETPDATNAEASAEPQEIDG